MTVEIICGDISALPSSDHATELLPLTDGDTLTLSCTDSDLKAVQNIALIPLVSKINKSYSTFCKLDLASR